jgi:NAD(P)-dependent dehydrogenase (short-subunit alcohol dehydrogenase family)
MRKQKSGHIINVSSVAGHRVSRGGAVYSATKTAVRVLSEGLRQEVKPYNIRTTVISPGAVATELPNSVTEPDVAEGVQKFYKEIAIPAQSFAQAAAYAMSQPEEVDKALARCAFLGTNSEKRSQTCLRLLARGPEQDLVYDFLTTCQLPITNRGRRASDHFRVADPRTSERGSGLG